MPPSCHRRENATCCWYTSIAGCFASHTHSSAPKNVAADCPENELAQVLNIVRIYLSSLLPFFILLFLLRFALFPLLLLPSSLMSFSFFALLSYFHSFALLLYFFPPFSLPYSLTNRKSLFTVVFLFSFLLFLENIFL